MGAKWLCVRGRHRMPEWTRAAESYTAWRERGSRHMPVFRGIPKSSRSTHPIRKWEKRVPVLQDTNAPDRAREICAHQRVACGSVPGGESSKALTGRSGKSLLHGAVELKRTQGSRRERSGV